jgi:pyruvate dehydrogenase (quinone)
MRLRLAQISCSFIGRLVGPHPSTAKPQVVAWELGSVSPIAPSCPAIRERSPPGSLSGTLAWMANGLPYTIAAQIAYPDRQCIAFVGDGGFSMLMAEFVTAVKYTLPIKVVIVKNNSLGQIKWEQMVFLENPEFECDLAPIDFAAFARACGGAGFTMEDPQECGRVLDQALSMLGPVIVDAVVDPFEPPMPPKVTAVQALKFAESMAKGTQIARESP